MINPNLKPEFAAPKAHKFSVCAEELNASRGFGVLSAIGASRP